MWAIVSSHPSSCLLLYLTLLIETSTDIFIISTNRSLIFFVSYHKRDERNSFTLVFFLLVFVSASKKRFLGRKCTLWERRVYAVEFKMNTIEPKMTVWRLYRYWTFPALIQASTNTVTYFIGSNVEARLAEMYKLIYSSIDNPSFPQQVRHPVTPNFIL